MNCLNKNKDEDKLTCLPAAYQILSVPEDGGYLSPAAQRLELAADLTINQELCLYKQITQEFTEEFNMFNEEIYCTETYHFFCSVLLNAGLSLGHMQS